ncbi:MAG TPA: DUF1206 domain-containing protein [Gemmatimonadaceae bacterium]|nr:DUF1206 domain-containing protein [Gemmatimonadaceae bacterium]
MTHAPPIAARAADDARTASAQAAPWIERLARVGFAAKAVLYITVGSLAARAALGDGGRTTGSRGALRTLLEQPLGKVLIAVIALGLFGYAAWRIVEAVADPERKGSGAKGIALRAGYFARGVMHAALGVEAVRLAAGGAGGDDGQSTEHWTARLLDAPMGELLVYAAGAGVAAYGLYQLYAAFISKLSRQLDLARLTDEAGRWTIAISRFGIAARGVVFVVAGIFLVIAARRHDPSQAAGAGESLGAIGAQPFGTILLAAVAFGLIAYGLYQLINARYRRIRAG